MTRLLAALALILMFASTGARAQASGIEKIRQEFAHAIYGSAGKDINYAAPQPLLRAVVVLRVRLDEAGRWAAEVIRENDEQPEMTRKAMASVAGLPTPANLPEELIERLHREGFMEAWLFQNDATYALKTLALPQRGL